MIALRSLVFNLFFFGWSAAVHIIFLPALAAPPSIIFRLGRIWIRVLLSALAFLCDLDHELCGKNRRPREPAIYAFKHQSAWDTLVLLLLFEQPAIVLKKELLAVPVFGWFLARCGMVGVDRKGGSKALKAMVRQARRRLADGRSLIIFPEGTRTAPGRRHPYHPGVAAIYRDLGVPVVPVALNSGLFWPRRSFVKRPGRITLEFLAPIAPGLSSKAFREALEKAIETASLRLYEQGKQSLKPGDK